MRVLATSALACALVAGLSATAEARSLHDRLRSCLELKDMTKQRLDCYDAILPPQANPMPVPAKVVTDCRFSKDENERLTCFNQFAEKPAKPRLKNMVASNLLEEPTFFKNYQLLRNISLLAADEADRLVILHPHANRSLHKPLQMVLDGVAPAIRQRVKVAYVEECLERLKNNATLPDRLRLYASQLIDKYVV